MTTVIIPEGTVFYHGTSSGEDFEDLEGPAWVTQSKKVAEHFAHMLCEDDNTPRVLRYLLVKDLEVLEILGNSDFDALLGDDEDQLVSSEDLKEALVSSTYRGWTIPHNYKAPLGDDTLLRDPEEVLELQEIVTLDRQL